MQANIGGLKATYSAAYTDDISSAAVIDYGRIGQEMRGAIEGMAVNMDSKPVGKLVASQVNMELGYINNRRI